MADTKIIALDDDPTGSQTVHGCLLLTRWDEDTLTRALTDPSPIFFVLTNTRGMSADQAAQVTRDVCVNLRQALKNLAARGNPINPLLVSRSDSTLRGHYPVETDVIARELGPFDAHFIVPAFVQGGRITRDSVHYVVQGSRETPAHETEFARDSVFGYHHSYLPDYVEEKTAGRIHAADVHRFVLDDVRGDLRERLRGLSGNACCVVDAVQQSDLDRFADQLLEVVSEGKRFLFRSAAGILAALARLPPQPVAPDEMGRFARGGRPGVVLAGSHVQKTTDQLAELFQLPGTAAVEVDVDLVAIDETTLLDRIVGDVVSAHARGETPVVYTSRTERQFSDRQQRLDFGMKVSGFLMDVVRRLPESIGFLISKGGITSNDVLSSGLGLASSRVLGQVLTGCSVVQCPSEHPRYPDLPVVIFPGNVGDKYALAQVLVRLSPRAPGAGSRE